MKCRAHGADPRAPLVSEVSAGRPSARLSLSGKTTSEASSRLAERRRKVETLSPRRLQTSRMSLTTFSSNWAARIRDIKYYRASRLFRGRVQDWCRRVLSDLDGEITRYVREAGPRGRSNKAIVDHLFTDRP